jgi:hypothetical protein
MHEITWEKHSENFIEISSNSFLVIVGMSLLSATMLNPLVSDLMKILLTGEAVLIFLKIYVSNAIKIYLNSNL